MRPEEQVVEQVQRGETVWGSPSLASCHCRPSRWKSGWQFCRGSRPVRVKQLGVRAYDSPIDLPTKGQPP